MPDNEQIDFQAELKEIVGIPGVKQGMVAEWAGVDPSTVTRWVRGKNPSNPVEILSRLKPHVERAREAVAAVSKTEVDSWRSLYSDLDPGIRDYVDQTGLLSGVYHAILCWVPSSVYKNECDVLAVRFFDAVWADMARRIYNIGDQSQIVTLGEGGHVGFGLGKSLSEIVKVSIEADSEVGTAFARLRVELNLADFPYDDRSIGFIDGFGYRFCAKGAIVTTRPNRQQTNDFLGAPTVVPCRRLNLLVCIPQSCLRGSPSAMSYSNRSMLKVLTGLDDANPASVESLLWPRGARYEMSATPNAQLKAVTRVPSTIENMPHPLQEVLEQPVDLNLNKPEDESIQDVLCRPDSRCFMLDLHAPHPSLTNTIVWRLPRIAPPPKE